MCTNHFLAAMLHRQQMRLSQQILDISNIVVQDKQRIVGLLKTERGMKKYHYNNTKEVIEDAKAFIYKETGVANVDFTKDDLTRLANIKRVDGTVLKQVSTLNMENSIYTSRYERNVNMYWSSKERVEKLEQQLKDTEEELINFNKVRAEVYRVTPTVEYKIPAILENILTRHVFVIKTETGRRSFSFVSAVDDLTPNPVISTETRVSCKTNNINFDTTEAKEAISKYLGLDSIRFGIFF